MFSFFKSFSKISALSIYIAKRKGLRYRDVILDNMGSEELAANLFRISQTESKLKRDNVTGEKDADETHYNIGKNIREVIAKMVVLCQNTYHHPKDH